MIFVFISGIAKAAVSPFRNLGFDERTPFDLNGDNTYFFGPISELLPGWQLSSGTNAFAPNDLIRFNLSLPAGRLCDTLFHQREFLVGPWPGVDFSTLAPVPFSLIQSGNVPADARTIRFFNFGLPLERLVNGTVVPLF